MADLDPSTLFGVKGLVAVITGGGTGVGLMLAQSLEANGAIVYILGRRQEVLDKAVSTAKHNNLYAIKADVTSKSDLADAAKHIADKSGYVNLVIANSGTIGPTLFDLKKDPSILEFRDFVQSWDSDEFNQTFAVNTTAVFYTFAAFLELLDKGNKAGNVEQKSQIIAITSVSAFNRSPLAGFAYSGSKAATTHMMKQLATRMVPYGIRANAIAPGLYPSEMTEGSLMKTTDKDGKLPQDLVPIGRAGDIQDMAGTVLFLVSRAGGYINGNVLLTDGGRLSVIPSTY